MGDFVVRKLGFPWETVDPFLFCVHHDDRYPRGNDALGPDASLEGRDLGQDFAGVGPGPGRTEEDGWRMYHGTTVPGFPQHPHRGFETVTIVRRGLIDHSDSLGAAARFGEGDVQWLTAGEGIVHAEMFPLLNRERENPVELFQIWLNLPAEDKLVMPHFSMLWDANIPRVESAGALVRVIAGALEGAKAPPPPPRSWAARADTDVAIWTLTLAKGASFTLPETAREDTIRTLYFFKGEKLKIRDRTFDAHVGVQVPGRALELSAPESEVEILLLQARPIKQPVVQYGPFVMNSRAEIQKAFLDYQATRFGGWPWPKDDPTHGREPGRFAKRADGRVERPPTSPRDDERPA